MNTRLAFLLLCSSCAAPTVVNCPNEKPDTVEVIQNGVWLDTVMEPINLSKTEVNYVVMYWEPKSTLNPLFQIATDTDNFFTTTQNVASLLDTSYVEDGWVVDLTDVRGFVFVNVYCGPGIYRPCWINKEKATPVRVAEECAGHAFVQLGTHTLCVLEEEWTLE